MSSFTQEQLSGAAFEIMKAVMKEDASGDVVGITKARIAREYVLTAEEAEAAAQAAAAKWTEVYFPE